MTPIEIIALGGASLLAGAVNAVAGGGTLFSFPAAIALGLPPIVANASNAVAMTPGSLASAWGYRRELRQDKAVVRLLLPPAVLGGLCGALLLLSTPQRVFDRAVPMLVLFGTIMLLVQNLRQQAKDVPVDAPWTLPTRSATSLVLQFLVGIYGGYFGAGMGIMTLALLSMLNGRNIHRMNGVKIVLGACVNGFASVGFAVANAVDWRATAIMAVGISLGGWGGAALARTVDGRKVRWATVVVGTVITLLLARKTWLA
jgi:uncharacterized membrane protein YfcA